MVDAVVNGLRLFVYKHRPDPILGRYFFQGEGEASRAPTPVVGQGAMLVHRVGSASKDACPLFLQVSVSQWAKWSGVALQGRGIQPWAADRPTLSGLTITITCCPDLNLANGPPTLQESTILV